VILAGLPWTNLALGNLNVVNVDIYSGYVAPGGGPYTYTGLVGSFQSPAITFGTDTLWNWHPFGKTSFGADITGSLDVAVAGTYLFGLTSDDGSLLFIDGTRVIDNGGEHGPFTASNWTFLAAGSHPFEVQFFENLMGQSGVDLSLPSGVTYGAPASVVPVPGAVLLGALGLSFAGWRLRRKAS
jgi:hypothetical protein